jgi:hypothetical protein
MFLVSRYLVGALYFEREKTLQLKTKFNVSWIDYKLSFLVKRKTCHHSFKYMQYGVRT